MKNNILQKIQSLLVSNSDEERLYLSKDLYNLVNNCSFTVSDLDFELKTKNLLLENIADFVNSQNPATSDNLKVQLAFIKGYIL